MNKEEKKKKLNIFAERLGNNELSNYEYAMWITDYRKSFANAFCEIYYKGHIDIPFRLWINKMIVK
jgi:hypothetical protein